MIRNGPDGRLVIKVAELCLHLSQLRYGEKIPKKRLSWVNVKKRNYKAGVAVARVSGPIVVDTALQFAIGVACAGPAWIGLHPGSAFRSSYVQY